MHSSEQRTKQCRKLVRHLLEKSAKVRTLLAALEGANCPLVPERHIAIEDCGSNNTLYGGLDRDQMQIVICSNRPELMIASRMESILVHELIHLYDVCTAAVDFDDIAHLACTEIRAANLAHCSFSLLSGRFTRNHHERCVKSHAQASIEAIKPHTEKTAIKTALDSVYNRCSSDLEPFGRVCQSKKCNQRVLNEFKTFFASKASNNQQR